MTDVLMVKVSPEFKAAINAAAKADDSNLSEFIRESVAERIGYDLEGDAALDGRGRPRTYLSEEQRLQARRDAERARQHHRKQLVEALMRQERLDSIEALEQWLVSRGVSVAIEDDEPVARSA